MYHNVYRFTCEGTITHWEAYTTGTGSHPMEFQVWREAQLLTYNLVGNNIFSTASPSNGMLRLGVPVDQQITVMPGDFVGVRTIQGNEDDPFQILTIRGYYINYNLTKRGFDSTPAQLPLGISLGLNCFTPLNSLPTRISITPLINAVLNSNSDVSTPDPSISPPATSQALFIGTGVLAGLLLTLLILFVVTVTLFCCYMQHKRGGNTVKGPAMTVNTAYYDVRGGEVELTSNTAYNHARGGEVKLTPNDAYNDQTGDAPYYSRIAT
ncbi:uncharacterized protein LOC135351153 isoform X2 [Halichondria panicea]|uniref:uncharacterized protein LOC135351153 isoform X2 n=1 Tax=Halichondria panicea TaxID=6063 RepID=UPI00312B9722